MAVACGEQAPAIGERTRSERDGAVDGAAVGASYGDYEASPKRLPDAGTRSRPLPILGGNDDYVPTPPRPPWTCEPGPRPPTDCSVTEPQATLLTCDLATDRVTALAPSGSTVYAALNQERCAEVGPVILSCESRGGPIVRVDLDGGPVEEVTPGPLLVSRLDVAGGWLYAAGRLVGDADVGAQFVRRIDPGTGLSQSLSDTAGLFTVVDGGAVVAERASLKWFSHGSDRPTFEIVVDHPPMALVALGDAVVVLDQVEAYRVAPDDVGVTHIAPSPSLGRPYALASGVDGPIVVFDGGDAARAYLMSGNGQLTPIGPRLAQSASVITAADRTLVWRQNRTILSASVDATDATVIECVKHPDTGVFADDRWLYWTEPYDRKWALVRVDPGIGSPDAGVGR
jgi:hypothetical protein